jgi:hypothetical protein
MTAYHEPATLEGFNIGLSPKRQWINQVLLPLTDDHDSHKWTYHADWVEVYYLWDSRRVWIGDIQLSERQTENFCKAGSLKKAIYVLYYLCRSRRITK